MAVLKPTPLRWTTSPVTMWPRDPRRATVHFLPLVMRLPLRKVAASAAPLKKAKGRSASRVLLAAARAFHSSHKMFHGVGSALFSPLGEVIML